MEEQVVVENEGLSFSDIWKVVKKYWIGLVTIIAGCLIIGVLAAYFVVPKKYEATQLIFYRGNKTDGEIVSGEEINLNTASNATKASINILQNTVVYKRTAEKLNSEHYFKEEVDYKDLMESLTISQASEMSIKFYYSSSKMETIPHVINTFTKEAVDYLGKFFVFEQPYDIELDDVHNSSTSKFLVVGASGVVGLIIGLCYEFIANANDKTVRNKSYIEQTYGIKVIGLIPDLEKLNKEEEQE